MHVLDKCMTGHRLLITYLPSDDVMSLEEFENKGRDWVMTDDCLIPIKMTLSAEDSEESL